VQGNSYLEKWGRTPCSIYSCAREQGVEDCSTCASTVCTLRANVDTVCPLRGGSENKTHWIWRIARYLESKGTPCHDHPSVPLKTLMRLRWYVAALESFAAQGIDIVSSRELADKVGVGSAMVRKDFSCLGELGKPGVGYHVSYLQDRIQGLFDQHTCMVAWVGAQWLSNVSAMFASTPDLNFQVVAAFDPRPEWIGKQIGEWEIRPLSELSALLSEGSIDGAVLALPENAKTVADWMIEAGVKGILNLTSVTLTPPPHVNVRQVDLIGEMMAMAMKSGNGGGEISARAARHQVRASVDLRHHA
jgi:redox-sensing transcriptional repressor